MYQQFGITVESDDTFPKVSLRLMLIGNQVVKIGGWVREQLKSFGSFGFCFYMIQMNNEL